MNTLQQAEHEEALKALAEILIKEPMTALQLSKALGCGKPTVYRRLEALKKRGIKFKTRRVQGASGPPAKYYQIRWEQDK